MKRIFFLTLLGLAPPLALYGGGGCSDEPATGTPADDAGEPDAPRETSRTDWYVPPPDADAGPTYDENGWLHVDFDPDYKCGFYTAPSPDKMPPPIAWEPCVQPLPAGLDCRQMKAEWQAPGNGAFGFTRSGWVDATNRVFLGIRRFFPSRVYDLVAEADGAVHHAIAMGVAGPCYVDQASVRESHVVYLASRRTPNQDIQRWGAIGGGIDEVARVLASYSNQGTGGGRGYFAGNDAFLEFGAGGTIVFDWTGKTIEALTLNAPGQIGPSMFQGGALFLNVGNLTYGRLQVWTQATGVQDLISYGNDVSHNASDIGTDGTDIVWVEGIGRTESGTPFATYNLMAAPYTTKASDLQKRRVRSTDEGAFGLAPNVVGCGFAARKLLKSASRGVRITRLSDGQTWRLNDDATNQWQEPVAITCTEVFIRTSVASDAGWVPNLARIRLDSLGPGEPAD